MLARAHRVSLFGLAGIALCALVFGDAAFAKVRTTLTDIDTAPQGAQVILVEITGERSLGVTPLERVRIPRGEATFRVLRDGYEEMIETVQIGRKRRALFFNLVRQAQPAIIELTAGPGATSASVELDGANVGSVPSKHEVKAGRHHVSVTRDGYKSWERWINAEEGQRLTYEVVLEPSTKATGSMRVSSSPGGAQIFVAGTSRGPSPLVLNELTPSGYSVEFRLAGYEVTRQLVSIVAGETANIHVNLVPARAQTAPLAVPAGPPVAIAGTLKVTSNATGAEVWVGGKRIGVTPLELAYSVGPVTLELRAPGFQNARRTVTVSLDKIAPFDVQLQPSQVAAGDTGAGEVRVVSSVGGAEASIDGGPRSPTPHVFPGVSAGTHFVSVNAEGYAEWRGSVTVQTNKRAEVVADLAKAGRLEITTHGAVDAEVFLDGELAGRTPMVRSVAAGTYKITVKRTKDGKVEERSIAMGADDTVRFQATWGEAKRTRVRHRAMPYSAQPIDKGYGTLDLGVGWPYLLGARISGGLIDDVDLGFTWRNAADSINDFEFRGKMLLARTRAFAVSVEGGLGFGLGPEDRNGVNARVRGLVSVMMSERAAVTLRAGLNVFSDSPASVPEGEAEGDRRNGVQIQPGVIIESRIGKYWNLHLLFEVEPFTDGREILEDGDPPVDIVKNAGYRGVLGFSLLF
jgi:hypothetical protein